MLALLLCMKEDKIPNLLVMNSITTLMLRPIALVGLHVSPQLANTFCIYLQDNEVSVVER